MPLGRAGPTLDGGGLPEPELFKNSPHTPRAPPKPVVGGERDIKNKFTRERRRRGAECFKDTHQDQDTRAGDKSDQLKP